MNIIWSLGNSRAEAQTTFEGMTRTMVYHFHSRLNANNTDSIAKVVRVAQLFPLFVEEVDNRTLIEEVSKE